MLPSAALWMLRYLKHLMVSGKQWSVAHIRIWLHRQYSWLGPMVLVSSCSHNLSFSFHCPGKPTCRCPVGFSGPFCERRICDNYCLNGGTCDVTQGNQPVCRCMAEYTGDRCLYRESCTRYLVGSGRNTWLLSGAWPFLWLAFASLAAKTNPHKEWIWIQLCCIKSIGLSFSKFTHTVRNKKQPPEVFSFHKNCICLRLQINTIKLLQSNNLWVFLCWGDNVFSFALLSHNCLRGNSFNCTSLVLSHCCSPKGVIYFRLWLRCHFMWMINSIKALYNSNQTSLKHLPSCSQTALSFSLRLYGRGADICHHYCVNSKACTLSSSGYVECVCPARFEGNKCEVDKCLRCHGAPCLINEETGDVVCKWVSAHYSCPSCLLPYSRAFTAVIIYGKACVPQWILWYQLLCPQASNWMNWFDWI